MNPTTPINKSDVNVQNNSNLNVDFLIGKQMTLVPVSGTEPTITPLHGEVIGCTDHGVFFFANNTSYFYGWNQFSLRTTGNILNLVKAA